MRHRGLTLNGTNGMHRGPSRRTERSMAQVMNLSSLDVAARDDVSDALPSISAPPRRGEILLIEDRDEVREGLAQLLELHGFMVTEAADGDHGMRELAANHAPVAT